MARTSSVDSNVERPKYRVLEGNFYTAKGQMLYPGDVLLFGGEPNLNFEPLNEPAREKMKKFLDLRNSMADAACLKIMEDKGVYLAPEKYVQRSFDVEQSALPKREGDKGRLMGMSEDQDDTEVISAGLPPTTVNAALPGSVQSHVVHGD